VRKNNNIAEAFNTRLIFLL